MQYAHACGKSKRVEGDASCNAPPRVARRRGVLQGKGPLCRPRHRAPRAVLLRLRGRALVLVSDSAVVTLAASSARVASSYRA
eukprot:scaffold12319_cov112-Isochrysis_galbana.AAC.8